jgi:hypothetical protein
MLEKHYKPADLESSIYEQWEASGAFRAGSKKKGGKAPAPYCIVIPPPNVTGSLHGIWGGIDGGAVRVRPGLLGAIASG